MRLKGTPGGHTLRDKIRTSYVEISSFVLVSLGTTELGVSSRQFNHLPLGKKYTSLTPSLYQLKGSRVSVSVLSRNGTPSSWTRSGVEGGGRRAGRGGWGSEDGVWLEEEERDVCSSDGCTSSVGARSTSSHWNQTRRRSRDSGGVG